MRHLIPLSAILLTACTTTRAVEVPIPTPIPGPTVYVPIPSELLTCEDTGPPPPKGAPLRELFGWAQLTRAALTGCRVNMEEIGRLAGR